MKNTASARSSRSTSIVISDVGSMYPWYGLPKWHIGKESAWVGKIPCSRKWQPTSKFLAGKFHGQRLAGYSQCSRKESDVTACVCVCVCTHTHTPPWYNGMKVALYLFEAQNCNPRLVMRKTSDKLQSTKYLISTSQNSQGPSKTRKVTAVGNVKR